LSIADVAAFLDNLRLGKRADKTVYDYSLVLNAFFSYCGKQSAKEVTIEDVRGYLVQVMKCLANNTYFLYTAKLKTFFKEYNPPLAEWIKKNVKVKIEDSITEVLTKQQLYDLAEVLKRRLWRSGPENGDTFEAVHWILASTGCRIGELCKLNIADVVLNEAEGMYELHFRVETTKTRQRREVFVPYRGSGSCVAGITFRNYLKKHRADAQPDDPLFLNAWGTRLRPIYVDRRYQRAAKMLGLKIKCTPHVLRHTYCTFLQENNVDPKVASSMTGHSVLTYLKKYGHPTAKRKKQIAKTFQIV